MHRAAIWGLWEVSHSRQAGEEHGNSKRTRPAVNPPPTLPRTTAPGLDSTRTLGADRQSSRNPLVLATGRGSSDAQRGEKIPGVFLFLPLSSHSPAYSSEEGELPLLLAELGLQVCAEKPLCLFSSLSSHSRAVGSMRCSVATKVPAFQPEDWKGESMTSGSTRGTMER